MKRYQSIFFKMNAVNLVILIPIMMLFIYINQTNIRVMSKAITDNNESQLAFLQNQLSTIVEQMSLTPSLIARDSTIINLQKSSLLKDYYGIYQYQIQLEEKLVLQSFTFSWSPTIEIFILDANRVISNMGEADSIEDKMLENIQLAKWEFAKGYSSKASTYELYFTDPFMLDMSRKPINIIIKMSFAVSHITKMLNEYHSDSSKNTFLITEHGERITADMGEQQTPQGLKGDLVLQGQKGHMNIKSEGQNLFVTYTKVPQLHAYLVDYVPLKVVLAPVYFNRNLFYVITLLLLGLSVVSSFLFYRHVQRPIGVLVHALKKVEVGDYTHRVDKRYTNEFGYVMLRFNIMNEQVQHLIENVYEEQSRSKQAVLKQLQAQINPHFLYNCLSFIAASAKIGNIPTVVNMCYHLGDYYRYSTRLDTQTVALREEMDLVSNYLEIIKLRLVRIDFHIQIPQELMEIHILRLIIQPIVENAIEHGLEPKVGPGNIWISGRQEAGYMLIEIEDDGIGMDEQALNQLTCNINDPLIENKSYGLWNVQQRLVLRFGEDSGIYLSKRKQESGIIVTIRMEITKQ